MADPKTTTDKKAPKAYTAAWWRTWLDTNPDAKPHHRAKAAELVEFYEAVETNRSLARSAGWSMVASADDDA